MDTTAVINKARAYLSTQMQAAQSRHEQSAPPAVFVTISRESGAGGLAVAEHLAEKLTERGVGTPGVPWAVFEKNLLEKVIEDNELPESYMDQMEEKVLPAVQTAVSELLAVHPSISRLVAMTSRTVLHLATMGNSILVGRGANVLTKALSVGLHVRLIAPTDRRLEFLMDRYSLSREDAASRMEEEDEGRGYYVKKHFNRDVDDPLLYDLVLNTHRLGHEASAEVITHALETKVRNVSA
jgi:cytidylate kinase